jgi:hypothetical protein
VNRISKVDWHRILQGPVMIQKARAMGPSTMCHLPIPVPLEPLTGPISDHRIRMHPLFESFAFPRVRHGWH